MTKAAVGGIARQVSLLGCGMLAGIAVTVLLLELALRRLSGPEYVRVRQAEFTVFTWFIGAVFVPTLIAVAVLAVEERRGLRVARRPGWPSRSHCSWWPSRSPSRSTAPSTWSS